MAFLPDQTYALLERGGGIRELPGGPAFWGQPQPALDALGRDWLVSEFSFDADWPSWEMHPEGDELVYLLAGDMEFHFETPAGGVAHRLRGRGALVVPRGTWHTARALAPSRVLFMTLGAGTRHRPA